MSLDYTNSQMVGPARFTTPADDTLGLYIPAKSYDYFVLGLMVYIITAGDQSTGVFSLETDESTPVTKASCATGTSAAKTKLHTKVAGGSEEVDKSVGLRVRFTASATDTTGVYDVYAIIASVHE